MGPYTHHCNTNHQPFQGGNSVIMVCYSIQVCLAQPLSFICFLGLNGTNFMSIFVTLLVSMSGSVLLVHIILDSKKLIG